MSSTSSQSQYEFQVTTADTATGNSDVATFCCYSQNGMSDTFASQIVQALRGITPPTGSSIKATVSKQDATTTVYSTNYTTSPVSYT